MLAYANDVVMIDENKIVLEEILVPFENNAKAMGLEINEDQT